MSQAVEDNGLVVSAVLSGNRNFEGRIHPQVRAAFLASPPLVVAYALAGTVDIDLANDPIGRDPNGDPVYLRDIWPTQEEIQEAIDTAVDPAMFREEYAAVFAGDERWQGLSIPIGRLLRMELVLDLRPESAVLPESAGGTAADDGYSRRARAGAGRRLGDDRSHLSRGEHRERQSGRAIPDRARRAAAGLQLVWLPPWQS